MNFKQLVLNDADQVFIDMNNEETESPFIQVIKNQDFSKYSSKRENYYKRLNEEKYNHNSALKQIRENRDNRIAEEIRKKKLLAEDRKTLGISSVIALISIALMAVMTFLVLPNGGQEWGLKQWLPAVDFVHFFDATGTGRLAFFITIGIAMTSSLVICIIIIVSAGRDGDAETVIGLIFGALFIGSELIAGAIFLALRLVVALLGYLVYLCISQVFVAILGVAGVVVILIVARNLNFGTAKVSMVTDVLIVVLATAVCFYFANEFMFGNTLTGALLKIAGWFGA